MPQAPCCKCKGWVGQRTKGFAAPASDRFVPLCRPSPTKNAAQWTNVRSREGCNAALDDQVNGRSGPTLDRACCTDTSDGSVLELFLTNPTNRLGAFSGAHSRAPNTEYGDRRGAPVTCGLRAGIGRYLAFYDSRRPIHRWTGEPPIRPTSTSQRPKRWRRNRGGKPLIKRSEPVQINRTTSIDCRNPLGANGQQRPATSHFMPST